MVYRLTGEEYFRDRKRYPSFFVAERAIKAMRSFSFQSPSQAQNLVYVNIDYRYICDVDLNTFYETKSKPSRCFDCKIRLDFHRNNPNSKF